MQNKLLSILTRNELARLTSHYDSSGNIAPGNSISYIVHQRDLVRYRLLALASLSKQWRGVPAVALTLTFRRLNKRSAWKQWPDFHHVYQGYFNPHSQDGRKAIVGNMHKIFSRWAYGKAARRYKKRLGILTIWEGVHRDHAHCHILLEIPGHWQAENQYEQHMRPFLDCHPAIGEFVLEPVWNIDGWLDYMFKLNDKADLMQAIDWDRCCLPQQALKPAS